MIGLNDDGCIECRAKLLIYPGDLSPEKITEVLGIEPSETAVKGRIHGPNSLGRVRINPNTVWFLISDRHIKSTSVSEHIDWIFDRLIAAASGLNQLRSLPGIDIVFRLTWWTKDGGCFQLTKSQLKKLAQIDLDLEFEIAAYPEEKVQDEQ